MKILIIGGTGKTGQHLVAQGLEAGHCITVLARTTSKIKIENPNLTVVKGNILQHNSVVSAVKGQDAVLSALGHKRFFIPTSTLSKGTENLIRAMKNNNVPRLICITS